MGIPYFFKYVRTRHKEALLDFIPERLDVLYVDLNCAVHRCAEVVVDCHGTDVDIEAAVISRTLAWIEELTLAVGVPKKELYLALDGVPPRAKTVQQRSRRFISALRSQLDRNVNWDSCCVTPGTPFMGRLNKALADARQGLVEKFKCKVTLSDSAVPGEGEHKIFQDINADKKSQDSIAVYGADADLLLLAMRCNAERAYVVRESLDSSSTSFVIVDIGILRRRISSFMSMGSSPSSFMSMGSSPSMSNKSGVSEFVTLCTLLGNDFIPPLSYISARERGVDVLLERYRSAAKLHGQGFSLVSPGFSLVSPNNQIGYQELLALFQEIAREEEEGMRCIDAACRQHGSRHHNRGRDEWMHEYAVCDVGALQPGTTGWRERYYGALFRPRGISIKDLCRGYIAGIAWTFGYYNDYSAPHTSTSDWQYPHAYSPTARDLADYLETLGPGGFTDLVEETLKTPGILTPLAIRQPLLQLLMVLPPASSHLLPEHVRPLMLDMDHGCMHYYPRTFLLSTYLKQHASDAMAILPQVDGLHLNEKLQRILKKHKKSR